jgi:hypothetical protein
MIGGFIMLKRRVMKVNVLGTEYEIQRKDYAEDPDFKKRESVGYCDSLLKIIVVCNMLTYPGYEDEPAEAITLAEKEILRHEIIHAFFRESGLWNNSGTVDAWATNEEMVDWIALQFPKILKAFQETDCL